MSKQLRYKGQFIKKKNFAKKLFFVSNKQKAKEQKAEFEEKNKSMNPNLDGRRIVEYRELGKNLKCYKCRQVLSLENIEKEKLLGLNSKLWVKCENCSCVTQVMAGKVHDGDKNSKLSDVNSKVVLGSLHAGVGHTALNKILACLNIPQISDTLFKRYEREVGPAIEKAAKESCKRAAQEERQLIIENIDKLCDELPQEIVEKIYPHLTTLRSNNPPELNLVSENLDQRTLSKVFDSSIGEIINIVVSYDMGWSKRGNGRSYDSLNGYGCIIGFLSGKILDYGTRNRKCKLCSNGHPKTDHDCRENFHGSAKAMERDVGAALVNGSKILKSVGLNVRVVVGDEDSSTIASIRRGTINKIFKLSDKNHLQKSFKSDLYQLKPKFKELARKNTIPHLKKCFNYTISQNKSQNSKLASILKSIPNHFFNQHENCGDWCKRGAFNDTSSQKVILKDPELYTHLYVLFSKYADNAHKIAFAASSQANESVNNIMAHKAPKSHCYSMSESSDYRYASAVCSKNDGESHLLEVYKILSLSPGKNTGLYASRQDKKRYERAKKAKLLSAKARRNLLAENREKLRKKNEKTEGVQYESNCGLTNDNDSNQVIDSHIVSMSQNSLFSADNCDIVYFDLETSGFGKSHEILQIAAMYKEYEFSVYVNPTKEISSEASLHTGLRDIAGQLYLRDKKVDTLSLKDALLSFLEFLNLSSRPCVLVAHNSSFDSSFLIRAVLQSKMVLDFQKIAGFCDSLSLFKKVFSTRKGEGQFKLGTLAKDILKIESTKSFHEALYDVQILKQLASSVLNIDEIFKKTKSWASLLKHARQLDKSKIMLPHLKPLKAVLKDGILKKMAIEGITYDLVKKTFDNMGDNGIVELMSSKMGNGKPRVTKNKRIINQVINFLKPNTK